MSSLLDNRRWARLARYAAYCAVGLAVVVAAAAFTLDALLDSPAVRSEIQRQLSAAVRGEVTWEDLNVHILPAPRGALRKVRVEIPDVARISAERVDAGLRFWPLLRGHVEITSVTLAKPEIRLSLRPAATVEEKREESPPVDIFKAYRSVMGTVVRGIREFAPDTVIEIDDAEVDVSAPGIPPVQLSRLSLRARTGRKGLDLDATMASPYWERLKLATRVEFADLSAKASLDVSDLKPQAWLDRLLAKSPVGVAVPRAGLSARGHTDGEKSLECEFAVSAGRVEVVRAAERVQVADVVAKGKVVADADAISAHVSEARLGSSRVTEGVLRYAMKEGSLAGDIGYDLDIAQGMNHARRLVPARAGAILAWFNPVTGRAQGRVKLALGQPNWSVVVDIAKTDASVQVRDLPGPVRLSHAIVEIDRHAVKVSHAPATMSAGEVRLSTLRHAFRDQATAIKAEFDIDLAKGMEIARRVMPEERRSALDAIQSVNGRAQGSANLAFGRKSWSVEVEIPKSDAQVQVRGLPAPARLSRGFVQVTPGSVKVERAAVTLLDAKAVASSTVSGSGDDLRVQGSVSEGSIGEKFLEWVWQAVGAPARMALKTPISVTAPKFAWGPKRALDVQGTARFPSGQSVEVDVGWAAGTLHVRRAAVKDERSNAMIAVRSSGSQVEGRFSGTLRGSSVAAMLRGSMLHEGGVSGELRFAFDRGRPRDARANGKLRGESLDVSWLTGQPIRIERIDLAAEGASLRVREAAVNWAEQRARISGEVKQGADGPVIDAQLDSAGIDLDALITARDAANKSAPAGSPTTPPGDEPKPSTMWPLPVTGRLVVRSDFLQRGRYRVAPVAATLALQPERARMELEKAQVCGISLPLTFEATPDGIIASAKITAQKQQLQQAVHCLTDRRVVITGEFDLSADISSRGKMGEFARNLKGSVTADMRDGRVMRFAMLGNILSMQNVSTLMKQDGPHLDAEGFPYRSVKVAGHFDAGRFVVDEGAFRSDAVGLAATGWISVLDYESRLTVLVAPFSRVDDLVRKVPVLGYVVGGVFTSVPVGVSGDIRDPLVVPLGPGAVTSEILGIFERTLKLPAKLVTPREKPAP